MDVKDKTPKPLNKKSYWGSLLFLAVLLGITLFMIFKDHSIQEIGGMMKGVKPVFLFIGLGMMFLYVGCEAFSSYMTMRALKQPVKFRQCCGYSFAGFYFASITPTSSGGQPMQLYYMTRDRMSVSSSSLTLLLNTIAYQLVLLLYGGIMFLWNGSFLRESVMGVQLLLIYGVASNLIMVSLFLAVLFSPKLVGRLVDKLIRLLSRLHILKRPDRITEKANQQLEEYARGADYIKQHPLHLLKILAVCTLQITALFMVPYWVYRAFGLAGWGPVKMIAVQAVLTLAVSSLPLPGAVGASENTFVRLFKIFFAADLLLPAMLLCRTVSFYLFLLISGGVTAVLQLRRRPATAIKAAGGGV